MIKTDLKDYVVKASRLLLNDAAYYLWIKKRDMDAIETPAQQHKRYGVAENIPGAFEKAVRHAMAAIQFDKATAHEGPTFHRLKAAHPAVTEGEIRAAILAAVKFDGDCNRYFFSTDDYSADIIRTMDRTKKENPGFSDDTYRTAAWRLSIDNRN